MTASKDTFQSAPGHNQADVRQRWIRPDVRRLNAGAAETGSRTATDLGVSYS